MCTTESGGSLEDWREVKIKKDQFKNISFKIQMRDYEGMIKGMAEGKKGRPYTYSEGKTYKNR